MATYNLISSQTLSSSASSVTFSSIPQTYTDLVLKVSARSNDTVTVEGFYITINSLTSGYSETYLYGTGSSANSANQTSTSSKWSDAWMPASSATSNTFSSNEIYIPNYTGSTYKPMSNFSTMENNASTSYLGIGAYLLNNTAAISSITLSNYSSTNFVQYSSFYLYGIKNS